MTRSSGFLPILTGLLVVGAAAIHAVGSFVAPSVVWGAHFFAFFPPILFTLATLILVVACGFIAYRGSTGMPAAVSQRIRPTALVLTITGVATALLWALRACHTYLGDGNVLAQSIRAGETFHERQPLTMMAQHWIGGGAFGTVLGGSNPTRSALAFGSAAAGAIFFVLAWLLARELALLARPAASTGDGNADTGPADGEVPPAQSIDARTIIVLWLVLAFQGYVQLFFGYVENYTFYATGLTLYLWLSLRYLRGASPLVLPGAALVFALGLHLSAAVLIPSFAFLAIAGLTQPGRRRAAVRDTLFVIAIAIALRQVLAAAQPGYNIFKTLWHTSGIAITHQQENVPAYMFSWMHIRDFMSEQLLIGPLGLLLFLPALALLPGVRGRRAPAIFFAVAGLSYLGASWLAGDSNLGYARNWDLLSPGGIVFTVAGFGILMAGGIRNGWRPALACFLLLTLYHTAPWIATNAIEGPALARLQALPLDRGRREVLVGKWYADRGDVAQAQMWYERAVRVYPANNNAQYLLGLTFFESGDLPRAARHFEAAVQLRPDKLVFRLWLIDVLTALDRFDESLPHLARAIEMDPDNGRVWFIYGDALEKTGRQSDADRAFDRSLPVFRTRWQQNPRDFEANYLYGQLLYRMDDFDTALARFKDALAAQPDDDGALAYTGYTLANLGRVDEARDCFARCLSINPDYPAAGEIRAWMKDLAAQ